MVGISVGLAKFVKLPERILHPVPNVYWLYSRSIVYESSRSRSVLIFSIGSSGAYLPVF